MIAAPTSADAAAMRMRSVAVGGDGTINEVLDGLAQSGDPRRKMGVLYSGTSPDFCRFHGIPTEPAAALACLIQGKARPVDVVRIAYADADGVTTCDGDCNDFNDNVHAADADTPAAEEVCDGQDNDCDGLTDEGYDEDGDRVATCFGDCADDDAARGPQRLEITDNDIDDDCDGDVDEVDLDNDGDGFTGACGDCDDGNAAINPHAEEECDRVDNNCDAIVDAEIGNAALCSACRDADDPFRL